MDFKANLQMFLRKSFKKVKTSLLKPFIYITRIDRFVSSTQDTYCYMSRFLYYFSVYVNLFKELFSYHPIRYKQVAYFVKASAKV